MNIFVTGGSGFIGRNLVEYLSPRFNILAPTHAQLELLDEYAVENFLKSKRFDVVVHCALKPGHRNAPDLRDQFYNNCRMFFNLIRNRDKFGKLIFLSSGLVYDQRYYIPKMKEAYFDTHVPIDEGGLSKYICAKFIEYTDKIVELRIFGLFGKYEDYSIRFISNAICKALFNMPITLKQNRRFDYLYIDDLMRIIDYFITKDAKFKSYNVTPNETIELYSLAEKVRKISGRDVAIKVAQKELGVEYSADNQRLLGEMKDLYFTPIDKAIEDLYSWYSKNAYLINKECLIIDK